MILPLLYYGSYTESLHHGSSENRRGYSYIRMVHPWRFNGLYPIPLGEAGAGQDFGHKGKPYETAVTLLMPKRSHVSTLLNSANQLYILRGP